MPSKFRIRISFPDEREMEEAKEKAKAHGTTVSKLVQTFFRRLPYEKTPSP
jgi:hypothetical protein